MFSHEPFLGLFWPEKGQRPFETLRKACDSFLKFDPIFLGSIRHDTKVTEAIRNQIPLLTRHPTSNAAKDITTIVDRLIGNP